MISLSVFNGCESGQVDLVQAGLVSMETDAPDHIRLSATVSARAGKLMINGKARDFSRADMVTGHIDIDITGPHGKRLLSAHRVRYRINVPRNVLMDRATFSATFSAVPPKGSVITLRHHHGTHQ